MDLKNQEVLVLTNKLTATLTFAALTLYGTMSRGDPPRMGPGLAWLAQQVDGLAQPGAFFVVPRGTDKTGLLKLLVERGSRQGVEFGVYRRNATRELVVMRGDNSCVPMASDLAAVARGSLAATLKFHVHPHGQVKFDNRVLNSGDMYFYQVNCPGLRSALLGFPGPDGAPTVERQRIIRPAVDRDAFLQQFPSPTAWHLVETARIINAKLSGALKPGSQVAIPPAPSLEGALQVWSQHMQAADLGRALQTVRGELAQAGAQQLAATLPALGSSGAVRGGTLRFGGGGGGSGMAYPFLFSRLRSNWRVR